MKNNAIDSTSAILNADQMSTCRNCSRARRGPRPAALAGRPPRPWAFLAGGEAAVDAAAPDATAPDAPAPDATAPDAGAAGAAPVADDPPADAAPVCAFWAPVVGMACVAEAGAGSPERAAVSCVRTEPCRSLMPVSRSPAARAAYSRPGYPECAGQHLGTGQIRSSTGRGSYVAGYDVGPDPRLSSGSP